MSDEMAESTYSSPTDGITARLLAGLAGPAEAITFVGGILLAAYVFSSAPSFDWTGNLEQFGIFRHYSIALGCIFGLVFLWPVWEDARTAVQRAGIGLFGLGFLISGGANAMATAGIRAGDWAVIGLLLLFPLALLVSGGGDVYAGERRRGLGSLILGLVYIGILGLLFSGYQLIAYVGSFVILSVWAIVLYLEIER